MKKNSSEIIDTVARVMAVSFEEDPMNSTQLEGLKKREQLLQAHSLMHARHALRSNMLHILDGDPRTIEYADKKKIPMALETHNKTNVGIYERFGFELVKTIQSLETPIEQYCMIREPDINAG